MCWGWTCRPAGQGDQGGGRTPVSPRKPSPAPPSSEGHGPAGPQRRRLVHLGAGTPDRGEGSPDRSLVDSLSGPIVSRGMQPGAALPPCAQGHSARVWDSLSCLWTLFCVLPCCSLPGPACAATPIVSLPSGFSFGSAMGSPAGDGGRGGVSVYGILCPLSAESPQAGCSL